MNNKPKLFSKTIFDIHFINQKVTRDNSAIANYLVVKIKFELCFGYITVTERKLVIR